MWGVLLGVMKGDSCLLGLMHQPYLHETFSGSNKEAFFERGSQRRPINTGVTADLGEAVLYCTHPAMFDNKQDYLRFMAVAEQSRLMRYGGDCYSYCMLACGFVDLVIEAGLAPYDIIPLIPIIEGAGGIVTAWDGGSAIQGGNIIAAANADLHRQAISILTGH